MNEESLFAAALEKPTPAERQAFLVEACGGDLGLRQRVERLLAADQHNSGILSRGPAAVLESSGLAPLAAGEVLAGRFKLRQRLGAGGMGEVWVADQLEPVQRRIALKVIRPGLDSAGLIARFEQERQALARMDHPHIAKVLDAGTTEGGRPYFVMELIKGMPITEYCDTAKLSPRERLELFVPVCRAVQHAHQKGIIHRDLKPSNVLVAPYDGRPVVKVIDFGIAKATGERLGEHSVYTEVGALVGTLEYMSPEQAELNNLDIDTRSDIYALGVLLYELLTGGVPHPRKELRSVPFAEMLRIIREVEPPRPSTRLASDSETLPAVAAARQTEPRKLTALVRGELDWIVMKCLEKDRARRYETANGLAMDVQRYLADEPVHACPPSAGYRLRKLVRRHKARLAAAGGLLLAVTVAAASIGWAVRDRVARLARVKDQVRDSLSAARQLNAEDKAPSARAQLAQARAQLENDRAALADLAAEVEAAEADLDRFQQFLELIDRAHQAETAPLLGPALAAQDSPSPAGTFGRPRTVSRRPAAAVPLLLEAFRHYGVLDRVDWNSALEGGFLERPQVERVRRLAYEELLWLADDAVSRRQDHRSGEKVLPEAAARQALVYLGKAEDAHRPTQALHALRARCRQVLGEGSAAQADRALAGQTPPTIALDHYLQGQAALRAKRLAEGVEAFEAALRLEPTHYWSLMSLGYCLCDLGRGPEDFTEAVGLFTGCILRRPEHAHAYHCRAVAYSLLGRSEAALADLSRAIALGPNEAPAWYSRGWAYHEWGRRKDALADYSRAIALDPNVAPVWNNRGVVYSDLGQPGKAVADFSKAIALDPKFARAWANRGWARNRLAQTDQALADCSTAIELDPEDVHARNFRGIVYNERGQADKAVADFSKAIELDPKFAPAWSNRGWAFNILGRPDEAVADCSRAIELDPKRAPAWLNRGIAHRKLGRLDKAVSDFSRAIELDPGLARGWQNRGDVYDLLGQSDKALADYSRVIELEPTSASAWYNRGVSYSQADRLDEAVADFSRAIELNPKYTRAWNSRGAAYGELGRWPEAVADFSRAVELDAKHASAWTNRGWAYSRLGRPDEAVADHSRAIKLNPKLARAWAGRGVAYGKLGQWDRAVGDYSKAVELAPKQAKYWRQLGVAHYRTGDWKAAVAALDKSLERPQGADGAGWLFLAMAHRKLGNQDQAHEAYEQAVRWLERNQEALEKDQAQAEELRRFRAEAEELLQRKK
jgi:tetratricopeptide (TPR) repeat protein/tRNA A-37 threonylcarbamoyl transferase component Bud32